MSQENRIKIARNVKFYRELHHYTREELSLLLGFENSYIGKLELCKINITLSRLGKISNFFNIDICELLKKIILTNWTSSPARNAVDLTQYKL